jgi:hypothetical protein
VDGFQTAPLKAEKTVSSFDAEELEKDKEIVRQYFDLVNEQEVGKTQKQFNQGIIFANLHKLSMH